jgi:hypothetical protein
MSILQDETLLNWWWKDKLPMYLSKIELRSASPATTALDRRHNSRNQLEATDCMLSRRKEK